MSSLLEERTEQVRPIVGPLFRKAARLPIEGKKRRKLLLLLAAYADAGEHSPSVRALCKSLGLDSGHTQPRVLPIDYLIQALVDEGYLKVKWAGGRLGCGHHTRRNVYTLNIGEPPRD